MSANTLVFEVGDYVVYPKHGVGRVIELQKSEIAGMQLELYVLRFEKEKMTLRVPTNKAEGEATALRSRIIDRLEAAKVRVADAQHEAVERAKRAADATDHYVHDHPWQAVGVAAAVGWPSAC